MQKLVRSRGRYWRGKLAAMRSLPVPTIDPGEVFRTCIRNYEDESLKARLVAATEQVVSAGEDYVAAGADLATCRIVSRGLAPEGVTSAELIGVYNHKFSKFGQPGRKYYNLIKLGAPQGLCPLCLKGSVTQLDHNFAKAVYPILATIPANLVPSCSDCNVTKARHRDDDAENTLHPYFHVLDNERWLAARVVEGEPPVIEYFVDKPSKWPEALAERARTHLRVFDLYARYSVEAARELSEVAQRLLDLRGAGGVDALRSHLRGEAESRLAVRANFWRTAFYYALAESDWFVSEEGSHALSASVEEARGPAL